MSLPTTRLIVLDTNILGYLYRREPLADVYAGHLGGRANVIAFQTLAEVRFGMEKARWGERRRADQERFLSRFQVVYPTDQVCTAWSITMVQARRAGHPIDTADAWIAATALALGCPLVTHNAADFAGVAGLPLISESAI